MQRTTLSKGLAGFTAAALLTLCIGGTTIAGIQGSGLRSIKAVGRISAVGRLTVNGVEYFAADARVSMDGVAANGSDLRVGHVVTINGVVDMDTGTARADEISFVGDVRGVITAVDQDTRTFSVLDQTLRVTDQSLVDDATAASTLDLQVGATVEASGFENSAGELVVSRVDTQAEAPTAQVRGALTDLDVHGHTFRINQLLVDYDDAEVEGRLSEGATVVAEGEADGATASLLAERVDVLPQLGSPGEKGDVEGIITSFASDAQFEVNGLRVIGDEHTRYVIHGVALGLDTPVHVRGHFSANGLIADKVDVRHDEPKEAAAGKAKKPKPKKPKK